MFYGRIERRFQERRNQGCSGILFDFLVEFDDFMENGYLWIPGNVKRGTTIEGPRRRTD
jgi:hypothetical protein|tara:strand:+ start:25917 stop:26093 length:177 start_codon:yes stop_codon:yes gene_type:complete